MVGIVGGKVHELSIFRIRRRIKMESNCIVVCMEQYMGRYGISLWVRGLEDCWNIFELNDALYNLSVYVMHQHHNVFDTFGNHARGDDVNARLAVLLALGWLSSTRYVQKLSHIKEVDFLLCTSLCFVNLWNRWN